MEHHASAFANAPMTRRRKAAMIIQMLLDDGNTLALVIGPVLATWGGLAGVFDVTAAMGALGLLVVVFWLPATPELTEAGR